MDEQFFEDFSSGYSLSKLSGKYPFGVSQVRNLLISRLGKAGYLSACRANGGRAVGNKLKDPAYRFKYVARMSSSVKSSLSGLLKSREFRKAWEKKALAGSKKGTVALRRMMSDRAFCMRWDEKCRKGGKSSVLHKSGFHSASAAQRAKWSIKGLTHTGRKTTGPKGEKMYNSLEAAVARILVKNQIPYAYEKTVMVPNKNGFISIDFALPGAVFVEATYWDDVKTKAAKLNAKYALLKKAIPNARLTVVTKPKFEVSLRRFLEKDINVQSLESFRHMVSLG